MITPILILADDLTGALDSSVGFADGRRHVVVARSPEAISEALALRPDVLAVNTASRELTEREAVLRVRAALDRVDINAIGEVFKKVDSRLKGHVGAETAALARWAGRARQLACPAVPDMGRIVSNGALTGAGVTHPIPVAAVFAGTVDVRDVASDADIDALIKENFADTLWIGARGLSFALARAMGVAAPGTTRLQGPLLIINGSRDPITMAQIDALNGLAPVVYAPDGVVPADAPPKGSFVISISDGGGRISGQQAAQRLAEGAARLAHRLRPASIILCGGESAQACLDQLGVNSLRVTAELQPGLPLFEAQMAWGRVQCATKSGGFGTRSCLVDIVTDVT